ncbi:hypothetical protein [Nocardia farcinica]|uniref:Lipoprotein n=1 Tax=Nocardia farcinica (strain IFM 10152) TaxID=247156 RepID=Q5YX16_NOCFA|nr:hypothetical protein [Nocardia farcinica]BAD57275.1 hypothetical protein NFA_24280 [Nocardia farcinica IFM 10152]
MRPRRLIALSLFALLVPLGAACTAEGPGSTADCNVGGCTITFTRGVDAQVSVLGVDAQLVAVDGNLVTLKIAGQQVTVPMGETRPAEGLDVAVQEVTADQVVVKVNTGLTGG